MIPSTVNRVPQHTAEDVNEQIRCETEERVARLSTAGRQAIDQRLSELDQEWDIERTLGGKCGYVIAGGIDPGSYRQSQMVSLPWCHSSLSTATCSPGLVSSAASLPPFGN